jgi:hypothetical protein
MDILAGDMIKFPVSSGMPIPISKLGASATLCKVIEAKVLAKHSDLIVQYLVEANDDILFQFSTTKNSWNLTGNVVTFADGYPLNFKNHTIVRWIDHCCILSAFTPVISIKREFMNCIVCKDSVQYAEPNQEDGSFKCYSCRNF